MKTNNHNYIEEAKKRFTQKEWKHWHTKSSSFERLPDSTKDEITDFLEQELKAYHDHLIGEVEEMRKEVAEKFDVGDTVRWINQGGNLTADQADEIKYLGHYQAYDDIITKLQAKRKDC